MANFCSVAGNTAVPAGAFVGTTDTQALTNKTINDSTNTIGDGNTYSHDLTAVPKQTGGWSKFFVTGSDVTRTAQTLADVTGLVTSTLSTTTLYDFYAKL